MKKTPFASFVMGGFECSTHRMDGRRLDLIGATRHDELALKDYTLLKNIGIHTARDGVRWHLTETVPGRYDFSSLKSQITAAETAGVQVIWDLFHYGYPEDLDIFSADFPPRLASFAAAFAHFHLNETRRAPFVIPVNEISFFSWIAGDIGGFYPFALDRGDELKRQLVRGTLSAIDAIRALAPGSRFITSEPAVHVQARPEEPWNAEDAESYRLSQYQALDMLTGRLEPELGGAPEYLDIIGINYYPHNQWFFPDREMIDFGDPLYRPFHEILSEVYDRYRRPMIISETGTESEVRAPWFRYVSEQSIVAQRSGVELHGICLYPIVDHPGWADDRYCPNGLWSYADDRGNRKLYEPLATEVAAISPTKAFYDQRASAL